MLKTLQSKGLTVQPQIRSWQPLHTDQWTENTQIGTGDPYPQQSTVYCSAPTNSQIFTMSDLEV